MVEWDTSEVEERDTVMRQSKTIGRRDFLARTYGSCLAGLGWLLAPPWSALASRETGSLAHERGKRIMLNEVTADVFAEHLGSVFHIHQSRGVVIDAKLIESTPLRLADGTSSGLSKREPCSIIFRGPFEPVLSQQIYEINHDVLGRMDLFLVALGPDAEGMRYEAIFN